MAKKPKTETLELTKEDLIDYIQKATLKLMSSLENFGLEKPNLIVAPSTTDVFLATEVSKETGLKMLTKKPAKDNITKDKHILLVVETVGTNEALDIPKGITEHRICAVTDIPRNASLHAGHYFQPGTELKMPWD